MEFGLNNVVNAGQEIAASTLPDIRLLNVPKYAIEGAVRSGALRMDCL